MIEIQEPFKERLQKALDIREARPVDIARAAGISESTMSQYRSGYAEPKRDKLSRLANALSVNPAWLMGLDVSMELSKEVENSYFLIEKEKHLIKEHSPRKIPVLGHVAAGIPLEMIEDIIDEEEIPGDMQGEYFALKIKGDSMEPKISNGDVVIVRRQPDVESGQIAIVTINGDDATCKRVMKYSDGIMLLSNNPNYAPMQFTKEEIEKKPIVILGKVVELRAKFE